MPQAAVARTTGGAAPRGVSLNSVRQMVGRALASRHAPKEPVTRTGAELDRVARDIQKAIGFLDEHARKAHALGRSEYAYRVIAHADRLFVDAEFLRTDDPKSCAMCGAPIEAMEHALARFVADESGARELVHGYNVGCTERVRHLVDLARDPLLAQRDERFDVDLELPQGWEPA